MPTSSLFPPVLPEPSPGAWVSINTGPVPLRCWWAPINNAKPATRAVIVLPEIFGLNRWVRGVADRLSAAGVPALAIPLFARTAPELELGYDSESTSEGRRHKEATRTEGILADVQASIDWLRQALESHDQLPQRRCSANAVQWDPPLAVQPESPVALSLGSGDRCCRTSNEALLAPRAAAPSWGLLHRASHGSPLPHKNPN